MKKLTTLPKWFNGRTYKDGDTVENRFTGEPYELNNLELSMYDFIIGASMTIEMTGGAFGPNSVAIQNDLRKGLDWFRTHNGKAYMALLD